MSLSLLELAETLVPRRYQEEIFSRAQYRNVIAALDTGSGKTYISTLLIKWIVTRDAGQGKICVFLVPKVALVDQQGDFITKETGLRVSKRYGSTAIDMTDRRGWRNEIETHDVLVMTAQIFLNILTHSHWTLDKVSLIVFDECHHTRKNHAYNGIMREYFQEQAEKRPKVFGMTASPIWNPKDAAESLATLERNLDAKVIAVREHVAELADHSPRPQEIIVEYAVPPTAYPDYPSTGLWERLGLSELPPTIDISIEKLQTRYDVTFHSLGPYGAELFLYHEMKHRIAQFTNQAESEMEFMSQMPNELPPPDVELPQELQDMVTVLTHCRSFFEDDENPDIVPTNIDLKWCSPKLIRLSQLLFEYTSDAFQGIVFVEQRHVAMCLSKMLPRIPPLGLYFKSAQLIGHGAGNIQRANIRGMALRSQKDVVEMFRTKEINLLVATSVAEEGLDFPACELVIRFDPIQHMVGYIQSRGRARQKTAAFVVMVQQGQASHVERYKAFSESEPQLRLVYQTRDEEKAPAPEEELEEGEEREEAFDHPDDLAQRERYVVPSTGAILTYNTSIGLLNHLCSLIPRDRFTPVHLPQYSGDFESQLALPTSLPLPPEHLTYLGPARRTKKEAKRAAAFLAVKQLHALGVFDDYLLPSRPSSGDHEDADGRYIADVGKIPEMMDCIVRDPWTRGERLWMHPISLDGRFTAGLVTGSALPPVELVDNGLYISSSEAEVIEFDVCDEWRQRRALEDFMRMGLWWCITGRGISLPLTCYLVPITPDLEVDWAAVYFAVEHPYGVADWSSIGEEQCHRLMVSSSREFGRPLLLHRIREDLTPMSVPEPGSREAIAATYHEYYTQKYTRKTLVPDIPTDGPCIEARPFPRRTSTVYALNGSSSNPFRTTELPPIHTYPQKLCRWAPISPDIYNTFHVLPALTHRLTDLYRARCARSELGLPPITDDLLVQALTLPNANAGFNNQRLETLGDSVLKLGTVVHLYNRFPHRHEGQLDVLRRSCVSNRTLLSRAKEIELERYLTSEPQTMRVWRYTVPPDSDLSVLKPRRWTARRIPKRSLQDCMEAVLGASYVTGGLSMSLHAGTALGLSFGGSLPWRARYGGMLPSTPSSPLFVELQELIGYQFKYGRLLAEAVTHPSFRAPEHSSYQRLEFLGDALIDLIVMTYLHNKFPSANSGQLSWARSRAVCAPALAWVAVNKLNLHRIVLVNNVELSMTMKKYVEVFEVTTREEIISDGWKHDPPKALSDVLESVLGAAFVDMDYNFEKASAVVEFVLQDLLETLSPNMPRDPVSELMVWSAKAGCRKISFRKSQSRVDIKRNDSISVIVHDFAVVGPITASNMSLAKGLAAERARQVLEDNDSPHFLHRICDCDQSPPTPQASSQEVEATADATLEMKKLDDETEAGFAALAQQAFTAVRGDSQPVDEPVLDEVFDDDEEEVVTLLGRVDDMVVERVSNGHVAVFTMDVDSDSENHAMDFAMDITV